MRPDEIKVGRTYYNGSHRRKVVGITLPALGIESDALVEYVVLSCGGSRIMTTGLERFSRWAVLED